MRKLVRYLSMPFGGAPVLPSGASFARNITKLAPVAAVGDMRCAVVAFTLCSRSKISNASIFEKLTVWNLNFNSYTHVCASDRTKTGLSPARLPSPDSAFRSDEGVVPPVCAASEAWQICPLQDSLSPIR